MKFAIPQTVNENVTSSTNAPGVNQPLTDKASHSQSQENIKQQKIQGKADNSNAVEKLNSTQQIADTKNGSILTRVAAFAARRSLPIPNKNGQRAYSNKTVITQGVRGSNELVDAFSDRNEIKEQVEKFKGVDIDENLKTTESTLGKLASLDLNQIGNINVVDKYFEVIKKLDIFGVTNALNSAASFLIAKKEKAKINVLKGQKEKATSVSDFPDILLEVVSYALKKVSRSFYTAMARGVLEATMAISRIISIISGAFAAPVTEIINLVALVIDKGEKAYRKLKGIWKFFNGTKGAARKANAEKVFDLVASGDAHATAFLKDYYASQFTFIQKQIIALLEKKTGAKQQIGAAVTQGMEFLFKSLKKNENHPEVAFIKNMVIENIATQFKSKPPSPQSTIVDIALKNDSVQKFASKTYDLVSGQ